MSNGVGAVITVLVLSIALILGIVIVDQVGTTAQSDAVSSDVEYDAALLQDTNTFVPFNDGTGLNETVWKTTGFAIELTGANDSFVESNDQITFAEDDTWSVSTWASVSPGAESNTMTAISADGRVLIQYANGTWSGWYYDEGERTSYRVNVSSQNQPGNLTLVTATANKTHFTIYQNTTQGDVVALSNSSFNDATLNSSNWNGRLEETRSFDDYTNASEQATLYNNPIEARNDRNRTLRVMYDQPHRDQIAIFAGTSVRYSNATFASGFAEQVMQPASNVIGADYEWQQTGPEIRPKSGGELDGFPVAYASYDFETSISAQMEGVSDAFELAAIVPILLIGLLLVGIVSRFS